MGQQHLSELLRDIIAISSQLSVTEVESRREVRLALANLRDATAPSKTEQVEQFFLFLIYLLVPKTGRRKRR